MMHNYHNFEDIKIIKLLINLNKIQKLYNIVKSNNFYFSELGKGAGTPYRCVLLQKSTGYFKKVTRLLIFCLCVYFDCKERVVNCTLTSRREV